MFTEDNLCHQMPIEHKHIISMFEQKIAKNFEEIVHLKVNLPIFSLLNLNIRLFINVRRHDCVMRMLVYKSFLFFLNNLLRT